MKFAALLLASASLLPVAALADPIEPPLAHVVDQRGVTHGLGFVRRMNEGNIPRKYETISMSAQLPVSFDARAKGWISPIKDQGACGSCWAHAISENLEDANLKAGKPKPALSPQQMVDCDDMASGCNGGSMYDGAYATSPGLASAKDYPYTGRTAWSCKKPLPPIQAKAAHWAFVGAQGRAPTIYELKTALLAHGSLFVTVSAGGMNWQGQPRMTKCGNSEVNHMVEIVGWTVDSKWIMRNSWGTAWGDKGFGYLPFGCDQIANTPDSAAFVVL